MTDALGESFGTVLDAARAGEGWAFERLFHALAKPVAAYLRGAGVEDPDGGANEVFLRAFRSLDGFDGNEDRFRSWMFTIAHHLLIDERRRLARRPRPLPLDDTNHEPVTDDSFVTLGDDRVRYLLSHLAPDQRDVVLLRIVADLSIDDTATALGKRPGAVKSLQHRAMRALRQLIEQEGVSP